MLSIDAAARDAIRREKETGQRGQWEASVCLGSEVVKELVTRGKAADRNRVDYYALALMRARVPEATEFFRMILRDDTGKRYMEDAQFHAALGLALDGEGDGFLWLIKNCEDRSSSVQVGLPRWVSNNHLSTCSAAALRGLSGDLNPQNKKDWESWWEKTDKTALPKHHVLMNDD